MKENFGYYWQVISSGALPHAEQRKQRRRSRRQKELYVAATEVPHLRF